MNRDKLEDLFNRLGRLSVSTKEKSGGQTAWTVTDPEGQTHRYVLRGVKPLENMEDDIYNLITWIWNAKDYLRKRAKEITGNPELINDAISSNPHLNTLGDLANGLKHGTFKKFALGEISSTFPRSAVNTIILGEPNQVEIDVADASLVEFRLPIIDSNGKEFGDAFDYAERAMLALENIRAIVDKSNQ